MGDHHCFECSMLFTAQRDLEEHARYYGHQAYIQRQLRRKKAVPAFPEPGPTQEEIDATLASIARARG